MKNKKKIGIIIGVCLFLGLLVWTMMKTAQLEDRIYSYMEMMPTAEEIETTWEVDEVEARLELEKLEDGDLNGASGSYIIEEDEISLVNTYLYIKDVTELNGDITSTYINQATNGKLEEMDVSVEHLKLYQLNIEEEVDGFFGIYELEGAIIYETFYINDSVQINEENISKIIEKIEAFFNLIQ